MVDQPEDPIVGITTPPSSLEVSLDVSSDELSARSLSEAIATLQLAQAHSPRTWSAITPTDLRALLAMVCALEAVRDQAESALLFVVPAALKAGASWDDIAGMCGYDSADAARAECLERSSTLDWSDDNAVNDEIGALLARPADDHPDDLAGD